MIIRKYSYPEINFKKLINLFNIQNNLIYFQYESDYYYKIELNIFEIINNFKSLKYLILSGVKNSSLFELKLNNLKHLELIDCSNFTFNNNNFNLNYLKLIRCSSIIFSNNNFLTLKYLELDIEEKELIIKSSISMLKCPELNELILKNNNKFYDLDFKNLMKLKKFEGNINYILLLEPSKLLESLTISFYDNGFTSIEKVMKSLKNKEKYYSVKKLKINIHDCENLNDLINFFPNLLDLNVEYWKCYGWYTCGAKPMISPKKIIIEENEILKLII